jgi:hypothetical protein
MEENELTIIYQYGGRKNLEGITRNFNREVMPIRYNFIDLDCTNISIGKGFNDLVSQVKTEYVLWAPDDFMFFPNGDWIQKAINILKYREDVGIIDLRKEKDGESPWMIDSRQFLGDESFFICQRWADRSFNLTPFIMRTSDLKKICPLDENDNTGNIAESVGQDNFRKLLGTKMARLDIPFLGVCFHIGWNRSRYFGYKNG